MVQKELVTAIVTGVIGFIVAFLVCNIFIGDPGKVTIPTTESGIGTDLANPDPEIFNFKALNPTVEVYVGQEGE